MQAARQPALDIARGLAVACMLYEHFVPEGAGDGPGSAVATALAQLADGKSAALFCVLLGMGMSLLAARSRDAQPLARHLLRRGLALVALGSLFGATLWPTEILMPLGCMTLLSIPLLGRRRAALAVAIALLAAAPICARVFAGYVDADWLEDGRHLRELESGWVTVRYVWIDGNYPLVPWLAFCLAGVVCGAVDWRRPQRALRCFCALLPAALACQAYAFWSQAHEDTLDPALVHSWVPTSIPFVLLGASAALATLSGLLAWQASSRGLPRWLGPLGAIGRTSLTHYVLHISIGFALLRHFWPDEDWPLGIGALAFLAYLLAALPATAWWLRRFPRGPVEKLLALAAGEVSSPAPRPAEPARGLSPR